MSINSLTQAYVVCDESGDFIDYACESCADEFAKANGLTWNWNHNFTEDHESGLHAYNKLWDRGEADYPVSCSSYTCGQYLDVDLTSHGREYMLERGDFPEWLYEAHGVKLPA
jgi:hypothetical protein